MKDKGISPPTNRLRIMGLLIPLSLISVGCTRKVYVPEERVHTEFKERVNEVVVHDSVTDSRLLYIQGDTVIDWRERVRWRNREVYDTVREIIHDSVPVPYPVDRKLTRWEQAKMELGGVAMGGLAIVFCVAGVWLIRKFRK